MKKLLFNLFTLIAVCAFAYGNSSAQTPFPTDGNPVTTGTVYHVSMSYDSYATLTPTVSGKLIQDGCPDLKLNNLQGIYAGYGNYGQCYTWNVEAGVTYTVSAPIGIWVEGDVCFYMESEQGVKVLSCYPSEGDVLSPNSNMTGEVILHFNTSVTMDAAYLCAGNVEVELENGSYLNNTIALQIKRPMAMLYSNGTLKAEGGENISIKIKGLKTETGIPYGENGEMTINYISSVRLADLLTSNIPNTLKSYYPVGDPEGIWTFVFDQNILDDGKTYLNISCGNTMSEDMFYDEKIYPVIDGATLTFNLCDKVRELSSYIALQDVPGISVKLCNVRDTNGNYALGSTGNIGSYDFPVNYNYIKPQALASEFVPASGSSLDSVDEIEIWYNNADMIAFDGVEFNYHTDNGFETTVVLKSELSMTLENNEMTIHVKVPSVVKGHDQVTVKLYNMTSIDGYQYRIQAQYDMFIVSLLSPIKEGEAIASTGDEDFVFNINFPDYYFYIRYDFYNAPEPDGWVYGSELKRQSNGTYTAYNGNFTCYSDFEPYMLISAYYFEDDYALNNQPPVEQFKLSFRGTTTPFKYSDIQFVSIDPEPYGYITPEPDLCFTVKYDGLVNIDADMSGISMGMGMGVMPFDIVLPVYDSEEYEKGYANTWLLYPNIDVISTMTGIDISIFAKDMEGNVVEGNLGAGVYDCMQFSYMINGDSNMLDIIVDPGNGTYTSLSKFVVTCDGRRVSRNWNNYDNPVLMNDDTWDMYFFSDEDIEEVVDGETSYIVLTCPEVTENGNYSLIIPESFFIIGEQFETYYNNMYYGMYTVSNLDGIDAITADKAVEIYNLQGMRINAASLHDLPAGIYIINGKKLHIK